MDDQELRNLLEKLHSEIENTQTVDEKEQRLLSDLGADIRELLDRSKNVQVQAHPSTVKRMEDSLDYLEVTHPNLTTMLSELLATLSNTGI